MSEKVPGAAALIKGISVLRAIANEDQPPVFTRLLHTTGLPKGTLYRILQALVSEGLLRFDRRDKTYHLGFGLLSLAYQVLEEMDIRDLAREELVRLRDLTGEAVHLAVRSDLEAVYVDIVESKQAVGALAKLGSSSRFHCSAVGKAIAANLPTAELAEILPRLPMMKMMPNTITSRRKLRTHFKDVRRQGYALNEEEETKGIHGIAAPVFGHRGEVVASICITIPSYRYEPDKLNLYAGAVMEAARAVSRRMGGSS